MGGKTARYKRKQERMKKKQAYIEHWVLLRNPPKTCPKCGTQLTRHKLHRRGLRGIISEGSAGAGIHLNDYGMISDRDKGLYVVLLVCPNCEYKMEID